MNIALFILILNKKANGEATMTTIKIDTQKRIGKIKTMHAVGQPPFSGGFLSFDFSHIKHLKNANIPYSRLHDVGGAFGSNRFVDIPNIFRDFDADENDPASYDFAFTDVLIEAMYSYGVKPMFRLGVTIENQAHIKQYRLDPPKDAQKWARICEHIVRHYNEGWANGFYYGIEYWEIWNEPDSHPRPERNQMWWGTKEDYFNLYSVTAKHLKACFGDAIKIGGYGACEICGIFYDPEKYGIDFEKREPDELKEKYDYRVEFFHGFLKHVKEQGAPLDFFSWHSYKDIRTTLTFDHYIHRTLCEYGYTDTEMYLDEWNNAPALQGGIHGSSMASALAAALMIAMQNANTDMLMYYDSRYSGSAYGGFFAPFTGKPVSTYYAFVAFGKLYELGTQTETVVECDTDGFYALSATDGKKNALMIVNRTGEAQELKLEGADLNDARYYILDEDHLLSMAFDADCIDNDTVLFIEW